MRIRPEGAAALLWLAACAAPETPAWHQEDGYRWREVRPPAGRAGFTPMEPGRTGIRFTNTVSDSLLVGNRMLAQGAGIALGDVDGDGLVDVFLARTEGPNALYRNLGGWRFEDVTERAGVAAPDRFSTGAAFADVDGDGDLDLVLLSTTGPNAIFLNDGAGRFTEHGVDLGLEPGGRGATTPALADVDGDGFLDLYVTNYKPFSPADSLSPQQMAMNQVVVQAAPGTFEVRPEYRRDFKLVMREDLGGLQLSMRAEPDEFYRNEGGRFRLVARNGGAFLGRDGRPVTTVPESFGLSVRFADLTGNGAPDLWVVNDFEDPDEFWVNQGDGTFRQADWRAVRRMSNSGMAVDVADVDGDGLLDLFEVDMLAHDPVRLKTQMPTHAPAPKRPGDVVTTPQFQRNTLFLNRGDGTLAEVAELAGVSASGWSWATLFLDVDLDGRQDILVANGHLWDVMDADTQERLQNRLSDVPWQRTRWEYPPLLLRNVAWRNRGDLTFEDAGPGWRFGAEEDVSHALAAADLDGDGDLDVIVGRLDAPVLVLRNDAPAPRIAVRLVGDAPNTAAVGATIRVRGGAVPVQVREVAAGGLYLSHSDYLASFATGPAEAVTIEVTWRDGRVTLLPGARPNRIYEITQATARPAPPPEAAPPPLFEDVSAQLGGHRHEDPPFDDWERQFLLPKSLAHLGPGLAWFDLDRDGREDLIVGAGRGGRLAVFRNLGGRLAPGPAGPVAPHDLTAVLGLAGPGGPRLLAGLSSWEAPLEEAAGLPAALGVSWPSGRAEPLLPSHVAATGPLALADYDGDGALDLFVGGRALPGAWPVPVRSALYRNVGGRFVPDTLQPALAQPIGLVSAAVFADVDGDGRPDLVLAREWDSILLLLNRGGIYEPAGPEWGLAPWTSQWIGIATGDFDGDGRLDLVATSWGRNVVTAADSARPLRMYYGDFGASGEVEMLLGRPEPGRDLAPMNSYPRARVAIPGLSSRIRSFSEYAAASLRDVLGGFIAQAVAAEVVTQDQMVFYNRGGRFEAVPLPLKAQHAPAFAPVVADFDGDGREDLVLSQNFSHTALGIPRYDAGRGLLLLADSAGRLHPVPGGTSGILIYGDQRGAAAADFDGDGRVDLAIGQNAGPTVLLRNRGARPGLRVRVAGPPANPDGVGTQLRVDYGDRLGPVREVQAGAGYWSQSGAVQVFGLSGTPAAIRVRWPGGKETRTPLPAGAREVVVRPEGGS